MTTQNYLAKQAGATTLDLYQDGGKVRITANPLAKYADVRISTKAEKGPVAHAVEKASITEDAKGLHVSVKGGGGGVTITGNGVTVTGNGNIVVGGRNSYSSFSTGGGSVFINGVDVSKLAGQQADSGEVLTEVVLSYGSSLILNGNADIEVQGPIHALDAVVSSGSLRVPHTMDIADVQVSSGSVRLGTVAQQMDIQVSSGSAEVAAYSGRSGRLSASSGSFHVRCAPGSSGSLKVSVSSGSGHVTGSGHLDVKRSVSSGSLHIS